MEPKTPAVMRLVADTQNLRHAAWLRLCAAALAAISGVWLFAVTSSWVLRATAGASVLFAMIWTRAQLRVLRSPSATADYLEIGEHHLAIVEAGHARSVPLSAVRSVAIDEDRLVLVLDLQAGPLIIEPRYRGVGLRELGQQIQHAVAAAQEDAHG